MKQALRLGKFWGFGGREARYFVDLVNRERAGTKELQEFYQSSLARLKEEQEVLSKRFEQEDVVGDRQSIYYSSWIYSAIHILITIEKYQTPDAISGRLAIPLSMVQEVIKRLKGMGIVEKDGLLPGN